MRNPLPKQPAAMADETAMTDTSNEHEIRRLVEDWAAAVRARDVEGAVAHHAGDIVMFDVPLPLQSRGMEEYRKTWELFFANNRGGPGSFEVTDLRIAASDTVAYCHALLNIFGSTARLTMGLRKERGQWLVAHEHHSYPLE
jgi:ketosteroid isomerase-like protein